MDPTGSSLRTRRLLAVALPIDRDNPRVRWTPGSEDDYDTLYEQHNPTLLSESPPTVLVADHPAAAGLGVVSVGLWALVGGTTAVSRAPGYLAVGLVLALVGRRRLLRAGERAGLRGGLFRGSWFLLRVPVAVGTVAGLARTVGVGSIEGVSLSLSVVSPLLVTAVLVVSAVVRGEAG